MDRLQEDTTASWAPKFFIIWSGQALSLIGSSLVQFALVWWMTSKTGSATILATASLVALLPRVIASPFIGPLIDRLNRRMIMIVADLSVAVATGVLMLLFVFNVVEIWHVYIILAVRSIGGAFHHPAMTSSTSLLVPEKHLTRVGGLNQTLEGIIAITAPPLGALLIMVLPTQGVLAIDLATAAVAILPLLFVTIPSPPRQVAQSSGSVAKTSYIQDLLAGFRYVMKWPGLLGIILLAMMINFSLVPTGSLMPLVVTKSFGLGAIELAWTETAMGIGIIIGGLLLSAWGGFKRKILTTFLGVLGIGISVLMMGLVPESMFDILLGSCFLTGFMQVFANGPLSAIFQSSVDKDMQGRVFSLIGAGASAMAPLSLLIAGPVSDRFGVRIWYLIGGSICILMTIVALFIPAVMNIEKTAARADQP